MEIKTHFINRIEISEVQSDDILVNDAQDGTDLIGNLYYQNADRVILQSQNLNPEFFNLSNKMAGDVLQKFSNYRVRLAIVGDFSSFKSQALKDFIYESNKGRQVNFVSSVEEALESLSR